MQDLLCDSNMQLKSQMLLILSYICSLNKSLEIPILSVSVFSFLSSITSESCVMQPDTRMNNS